MPKGGDNRTITEKIADLLADGLTSNEIAAQLMIPYPQVRSRYLVICHALGEKPDAE
jgi:DNA-binding NarL/FixJ family response regulator